MNERELFAAYGQPRAAPLDVSEHVPAVPDHERFSEPSVEGLFWQHIVRLPGMDACHRWSGHHDRRGKALFRVAGRTVLARIMAWEIANGLLDPGDDIEPRCGNEWCVNDGHMELCPQSSPPPNPQSVLSSPVPVSTYPPGGSARTSTAIHRTHTMMMTRTELSYGHDEEERQGERR